MKKIDLLIIVSALIFTVSGLLFFSFVTTKKTIPNEMLFFLITSMVILVASILIDDQLRQNSKPTKPINYRSNQPNNLTNCPQITLQKNKVPLEKQNTINNQNFKWINQWKEVKNLDFSTEQDHFFLERRYLDDFSKELISHAKTDVLIANPFIQNCDLSNTLREAQRNGVKIKIITRRPTDEKPEYLEKRTKYHSTLIHEGIALFYDEQVHAKIIITDNKVAIVSSMNFFATSSAGASWEAGLVTINPNVVKSIADSFSKVLNDIANNSNIPKNI